MPSIGDSVTIDVPLGAIVTVRSRSGFEAGTRYDPTDALRCRPARASSTNNETLEGEGMPQQPGDALIAANALRDLILEYRNETENRRAAGPDSPIERAHRDIHAVMQHVALQPFWLEQAGRVRLGLEATFPLFFR
jgi:hypothetical protein